MHERDIDPESNFFDQVIRNCFYYTEPQFKEKFNLENGISIVHFNSRSLYANFDKIRDYLQHNTMHFNIVAISESWLSHDKGIHFELESYQLHFVNRVNKRGGGVAMFVDNRLKYMIVESMTTVIDDICECITVEIDMGKMKNVIVSCVYRAPNSGIESFKDVFEAMALNAKQKVAYFCGDYNIDFLNPSKSTAIVEFIDAMYSAGLYPCITKPSRITTHSATVIDNIFTNNISNLESGLLINDITDHLPIFVLHECKHYNLDTSKINIQRRLRTDYTLNKLKNDLLAQDWKHVYEEGDVDLAYSLFLNTFLTLYYKNCPIQQSEITSKRPYKPWVTRGLMNACKKKNTL